jgi:putative DNA primase/helicase
VNQDGVTSYYFYLNDRSQYEAVGRDRFGKSMCLTLCPNRELWSQAFPASRGNASVDWEAAEAKLKKWCHQRDFRPENVRRRGWWLENNQVVGHVGNELIVDGRPTHFRDHRRQSHSPYVYVRSLPVDINFDAPMRVDETKEIADIARAFAWKYPLAGRLLSGWAAIAPICGILNWRPHIYITGPAGCGKTTVQTDYLKVLFGNWSDHNDGDTSAASFRRLLDGEARPVVVDEMEMGKDSLKLEDILTIARGASAKDGHSAPRVSSTGIVKNYIIRSCFSFAGINPGGVLKKADLDRITFLELRGQGALPEDEWNKLEDRLAEKITPASAARLQAAMIRQIPNIIMNIKKLTEGLCKSGLPRRFADQFAPMLAGHWAMTVGEEMDEDDVETFLSRPDMDFAPFFEETAGGEDHQRVLSEILSIRVSARSERAPGPVAISTLIKMVAEVPVGNPVMPPADLDHMGGLSPENAHLALQEYGIRVINETQQLAIAQSHPQLKNALRALKSDSENGWHRQLMRHPLFVAEADSAAGAKRVYFRQDDQKQQMRAVHLDLKGIVRLIE